MTTKKKAIVYGGLFLLLLGIVKLISYELGKSFDSVTPTLNSGEKAKIIIDNRTGKVDKVEKDEKGNVVVTPIGDGSRGTVVTIDDDGDIHVTVKNKGFIFEPGLTAFYSDKLRLGLDANLFFYKRYNFGLGAGLSVERPTNADLYVKVGYQLPFKTFSNTEIFAGYSLRRQPVLGLRIRF